eukprot:Sspe_Gene.48810::Locus_25736_Transcript_1_1_Confidence_1.000_Length_1333::g.48810::m.48810
MVSISVNCELHGEHEVVPVFLPSARPSLDLLYSLVETALNLEAIRVRPEGEPSVDYTVSHYEIYDRGYREWVPLTDSDQLAARCHIYAHLQRSSRRTASTRPRQPPHDYDRPTTPTYHPRTPRGTPSLPPDHTRPTRDRHDTGSPDRRYPRPPPSDWSDNTDTDSPPPLPRGRDQRGREGRRAREGRREKREGGERYWEKYLEGVPVSSRPEVRSAGRLLTYDGRVYDPTGTSPERRSRQLASPRTVYSPLSTGSHVPYQGSPSHLLRTYDGRVYNPSPPLHPSAPHVGLTKVPPYPPSPPASFSYHR